MTAATELPVAWQPQPGPQTVFLASGADDCLYGGALGGGKSQALLWGATRQIGNRYYRALILRKTFPELRELMDEAILRFPEIGGRWVASEKRSVFPSGATIEFGYCGTYEEAMQYRGKQYQYIAYDEIGDLADERPWDFLQTRLRSGDDATLVKQARCSANPGGAGHGWIKRRYIDACPPDGTLVFDEYGNSRAFVQAKLSDNKILLAKDPFYGIRRLKRLPEVTRQQLEDGRWDVGMGLAFSELTRTSHLVPAVSAIRPEWQVFGSMDWGFGHRWYFLLWAVLPDGKLMVVDSTGGRGMVPTEIAERCADLLDAYGLGFLRLAYTVAGSDVKIVEKARGNFGPSVLEQFMGLGWYNLMMADQGRVTGYSTLLQHLHDKTILFCDTPGNVGGIEQLLGLVRDPDAPNDVLKVNVNPVTGEGGDDWYEAWRYGAMSRPQARPAKALVYTKQPDHHLPRWARSQPPARLPGVPATSLPSFARGQTRSESV